MNRMFNAGRISLAVTLLSFMTASSALAQSALDLLVSSPDGRVEVSFGLDENGAPHYSVELGGEVLVRPSPLGLQSSVAFWDRDLTLVETSAVEHIDETYSLLHGKQRDVHYVANRRTVSLVTPDGQDLEVDFQVSDDGVALRYRIPSEGAENAIVHRELTGFRFSPETVSWLMPMDHPATGWMQTNPSYEAHYTVAQPVGMEAPTEVGWSMPALFHDENAGWALVMESGVDETYVGSRLTAEPERGLYRIAFPDRGEGYGPEDPVDPTIPLPFESPWRVIIVGETLAPIVESTLVADVSPPAIIADTAWIEPGKAGWSWLPLKDESMVMPVQKEFVDMSAKYGFEYVLVDALWDVQLGYEGLAELEEYAEERGVELLVWYNSNGSWNGAPQTPKDRMHETDVRRAEFARLQEMGIRGVKIDFLGGDKQSVIRLYHEIMRDAADFNIMVNFHGATVPRGWQRTYPHLVTMEAVRGYEYTTFDQYNADHAPRQGTIFPFTRNAVGPMDYTPTMLTPQVGASKRITRNGYDLAMLVVFESGIQHLGVTPDVMEDLPAFVLNYLRTVPSVWDETRFVMGYPGDYIVIARRDGNRWFVAGINGRPEARTVRLDLPFLGDGWEGMLIGDAEDASGFSHVSVSAGDEVEMVGYGGFVVEIGD